MEFTNCDTYQVSLTNETKTLNVSARGGSSVLVKADSANTSPVYIGPATTRAGTALNATVGYPLAAGESVALDLTMNATTSLSAYSAGTSQVVRVLVLHP